MTANQAALAERYGIKVPYPPDLDLPPPELFPRRLGWIVRRGEAGRELASARWGLPVTLQGKTRDVTNIRNLSSPAWRTDLKLAERRCLVPVTAFSEYGQVRGEDGKLPLHWFDVPSRPIFSFAGLWRPVEAGDVFGFLTTDPNSVVRPIHPKAMPVILDDEGEERWLAGELDGLVEPFPAQLMTVEQTA